LYLFRGYYITAHSLRSLEAQSTQRENIISFLLRGQKRNDLHRFAIVKNAGAEKKKKRFIKIIIRRFGFLNCRLSRQFKRINFLASSAS